VNVLKYATTRPWYESFYNALPEINAMKMKSGSIGGCISYAGYQFTKGGNGYIFAIIVNNYNGPSSSVIKKMWQVVDQLK
jgi:D-alanyl-D-alanine carboxypeptidase/D-alanyl-D-alanine-endopeptidase (penicillin-binding protein 4)